MLCGRWPLYQRTNQESSRRRRSRCTGTRILRVHSSFNVRLNLSMTASMWVSIEFRQVRSAAQRAGPERLMQCTEPRIRGFSMWAIFSRFRPPDLGDLASRYVRISSGYDPRFTQRPSLSFWRFQSISILVPQGHRGQDGPIGEPRWTADNGHSNPMRSEAFGAGQGTPEFAGHPHPLGWAVSGASTPPRDSRMGFLAEILMTIGRKRCGRTRGCGKSVDTHTRWEPR